jgi:hypothetical protein
VADGRFARVYRRPGSGCARQSGRVLAIVNLRACVSNGGFCSRQRRVEREGVDYAQIGNSGTVEVVAGCSETLWRSQQTALAAQPESD